MGIGITFFSIVLTVVVYLISLKLAQKYPSVLTMPIFFCTATIILILSISQISYEQYEVAKEIMSFLLGPATVALAVPLYRQREIVFKNITAVFTGILLGTLSTIISAIYLTKWFGLPEVMVRSVSIKSITIPIANEVTPIIEADISIVTVFVMITGMFGAMFGTTVLNLAKVRNPIGRGLSFGTVSHGIGTSQAMQEGEIEGATSSVAMGLTGIITAFIIPLLLPLFL